MLLLFEWLLIWPHELGHALAAKYCGLPNVRILIGVGKPIFSFRWLGFDWLIGSIPFGGLTLTDNSGALATRRNLFWFVAAGPAVNLLIGIGLWAGLGGIPLQKDLASLFFWANVMVLGFNLFPFQIETIMGKMPTDGMYLLFLLFRWNRPFRFQEQSRLSPPKVFASMFRALLVFFMGLATCFFGAIVVLLLAPSTRPHWSLSQQGFFVALFLFFTLASSWSLYRLLKKKKVSTRPFAEQAKAELFSLSPWLAKETLENPVFKALAAQEWDPFESLIQEQLSLYPDDLLLQLLLADAWATQQKFEESDQQHIKLLEKNMDLSEPILGSVVRALMFNSMQVNEPDRAEALFEKFFLKISREDIQQGLLLDWVLLFPRLNDPSAFSGLAKWAKQAADALPDSVDAQIVFGFALLETGQVEGADAVLKTCEKTGKTVKQQSLVQFCLGRISLVRGETKKATTRFQRCLTLATEEWLKTRVKTQLRALAIETV
ncbi:MAG: site-2 protease family protein [Acidobacteria bacterium]|nr:site-2 protease family protein [Acidobacteriota bacterium]